MASLGNSLARGAISLDRFQFLETSECLFAPPEAKPPESTIAPTTTSAIPTEPPKRNRSSVLFSYRSYIRYQLTAFIFCTFEEDFCNWEHIPDEENGTRYAWTRKNSVWLEGEAIPGPPNDHTESREKIFAIASNMLPSDGPAESTADLISPYIIGVEHKKECFKFWFYFGVLFREWFHHCYNPRILQLFRETVTMIE